MPKGNYEKAYAITQMFWHIARCQDLTLDRAGIRRLIRKGTLWSYAYEEAVCFSNGDEDEATLKLAATLLAVQLQNAL